MIAGASGNSGTGATSTVLHRLVFGLVALVAVVGPWPMGIGGTHVPAAAQVAEVYTPPVDAPVLDPFRPPDQPWLAGNRGLEYDTTAGSVVHAIGSGLVVFAGPVAGQLYVTVLHGDGIRSSYSYLSAISVTRGDRVRGTQAIGIAGEIPFHLGARIGDTYIDPASLFGSRVGAASVFLVPLGGDPSPGADSASGGASGGSRSRPDNGAAPGATAGAPRPAASRAGAVAGDLVTRAGRDLARQVRVAGALSG